MRKAVPQVRLHGGTESGLSVEAETSKPSEAFSVLNQRRTAKDVERELRARREGRGLGFGPDYAPYIQLRRNDFVSRAVSFAIPRLQGRQLHTISTIEKSTAFMLHRLGAKSVYEQRPLAIDQDDPVAWADEQLLGKRPTPTLEICKQLGLAHPLLTDRTPKALTADFVLLGCCNRASAIFVRNKRDVPSRGSRQWELLEIQRSYYRSADVPLAVCTEANLDPGILAQLTWAFDGMVSVGGEPGGDFVQFLQAADAARPLNQILEAWEKGLVDGIARFKAAVFTGYVDVPSRSTRPRLVSHPWPYRVIRESERAARLGKFIAKLLEDDQ